MFKMLLVALAMVSASASASQIPFGMDCMIHDNQGKMLADLGMIGMTMHGYVDVANFTYGNIKIEANLNEPFAETPEVKSPQARFTVRDEFGNVLASVVATVNENSNMALLVPISNVYLHCDKMSM